MNRDSLSKNMLKKTLMKFITTAIFEIIRFLMTTTKFDFFSLLLKKVVSHVIDVIKSFFSIKSFIIMSVVVKLNQQQQRKFFAI